MILFLLCVTMIQIKVLYPLPVRIWVHKISYMIDKTKYNGMSGIYSSGSVVMNCCIGNDPVYL